MFVMGYSIRKVLRYGFTLIDRDIKLEQEHVVVWKTACKRSCHVWVSLSYIYLPIIQSSIETGHLLAFFLSGSSSSSLRSAYSVLGCV